MSLSGKIQKLPLRIRKIILFTVVIIIGIVLVWAWTESFNRSFRGFQKEEMMKEFKIPSLKEKIKEDFPRLEIPEILTKPRVPDTQD